MLTFNRDSDNISQTVDHVSNLKIQKNKENSKSHLVTVIEPSSNSKQKQQPIMNIKVKQTLENRIKKVEDRLKPAVLANNAKVTEKSFEKP